MNLRKILALVVNFVFATPSIAQTLKVAELEVAGRNFKNASLNLEGTNVKVAHDSGIARIPLENFPKTLQDALLPDLTPKKQEKSSTATKQKPIDTNRVSEKEKFRIIERKAIPNGGETFKILIAPELATEKGIKEIIQEIRRQTANQRNTFAFIYDDMRALQMQSRIFDEPTAEDEKLYELHFKAIYKKNGNTGYHESWIWPEGQSGREIVIRH